MTSGMAPKDSARMLYPGIIFAPLIRMHLGGGGWWERVEVQRSSGGSHIFAHSPRITPRMAPKDSARVVYPGIIFDALISMHLGGGGWWEEGRPRQICE